MQDREVSCMYYEHEGSCLKGRKGTFWKECQTCKNYAPKRGSAPARKNLKRQKIEKIQKNDIKQMLKDY